MPLFRFLLDKLHLKRESPKFPECPDNPIIVNGSESFLSYPAKTYLGAQGANAYYMIAVLRNAELPKLKALVQSRFHSQEPVNDSIVQSELQEALAMSYREEFGGVLVELTTNSVPLLQSIDKLFDSPPAPWLAFPHLEPIEVILPKQGSLEYWWDHIWHPYWSSLSPNEKEQYRQSAPTAWREVLL
ncbi:hypothetical protein [Pseudomonas triclosanedens]|uniref:hypothetical protein n=1 Tax=Pseudomonas triclosanedens TaxID=2961893 RepID=UPI0020C5A50E|nr:hypothetical protein [Pseudomonas triclosanedens]